MLVLVLPARTPLWSTSFRVAPRDSEPYGNGARLRNPDTPEKIARVGGLLVEENRELFAARELGREELAGALAEKERADGGDHLIFGGEALAATRTAAQGSERA